MRSRNRLPAERANNHANRAVRRLPRCNGAVGLGAKRPVDTERSSRAHLRCRHAPGSWDRNRRRGGRGLAHRLPRSLRRAAGHTTRRVRERLRARHGRRRDDAEPADRPSGVVVTHQRCPRRRPPGLRRRGRGERTRTRSSSRPERTTCSDACRPRRRSRSCKAMVAKFSGLVRHDRDAQHERSRRRHQGAFPAGERLDPHVAPGRRLGCVGHQTTTPAGEPVGPLFYDLIHVMPVGKPFLSDVVNNAARRCLNRGWPLGYIDSIDQSDRPARSG